MLVEEGLVMTVQEYRQQWKHAQQIPTHQLLNMKPGRNWVGLSMYSDFIASSLW
jgi:hypothetical protein